MSEADVSGEGDPQSEADAQRAREEIVARQVYMRGTNRPFGELTLEDVHGRADELRAATGWGPTARVAPVAHAWRELAMTIEKTGVACVGELDGEELQRLAPRLWVIMPGGA
jgi:hypothetical protein